MIGESRVVYVRMLEGVETFVPVVSRQIEGDKFEIISNNDLDLEEDATSIYEFFPGDVVECENKVDFYLPVQQRKENFLLATRLISTVFPNRKLYQLIYLIVKSLGEIRIKELSEFEEEIKQLCSDIRIIQRNHPVVKSWLNANCR
jgi:hypothetical protein